MSKKIALVFGGTRGIGAATVQKLAEGGFEVAYTYVSSAPNVPAKIAGASTKGYQVDIREAAQVAQVFTDVARDFGSMPHCVVANAGINVPPGTMATFDSANFRQLVETNIVGAFNVLSAAARHVVDGGTIIGLAGRFLGQQASAENLAKTP